MKDDIPQSYEDSTGDNHDETKSNTLSGKFGAFVESEFFQFSIITLIIINAIMMGIGTFDFVTENDGVNRAFEIVDLIFLIIFSVELLMHLIHKGRHSIKDGWVVFDFIVVLLSWFSLSVSGGGGVQVLRSFRVFRVFTILSKLRVMRNLISAILKVIPRLLNIVLLMIVVFWIFAVMFTDLFRDMYKNGQTSYDYFSRFDKSLLTLFQIMTLDGWADVAREVMAVYPWSWVLFIAFVAITGFIFYNLIIAVICESLSHFDDSDKDHLHGRQSADDDEDDETDSNEVNDYMVDRKIDSLGNEVQFLASSNSNILQKAEMILSELKSLDSISHY